MTWEDGYGDYPKPIEPVENISDDIYFKVVNEIWSSSCETNTCNDGSGGYPIGLAVNDMSCHHYPMGEGYTLVLYPYHYMFTTCLYPPNGIIYLYLYKMCLQNYEIEYPCKF